MMGVKRIEGLVSEAKPGYARVSFAQCDDLLSQWLPVLVAQAQDDKEVWTLNVGTLVACLMDEDLMDGWVVGALYNDVDAPPTTSASVWRKQFADGASVEYDKASGAMKVSAVGDLVATVGGSVTVVAQEATVDATKVMLAKGTRKGVVTGDCVCAFTGKPHPHVSAHVLAGM